MGTATPAELALQGEVRQLRERIAELENERQTALQQAEEQNRRLLAAVQDRLSTAGAAAHENAARLEAALESMTDAVFIADAQGRFIHTNGAFATYHRFRNREECSKNIADCPDNLNAFLPDGTQAPPEMWAVPRALRGETASNTEYTLQRRDTGETWVGRYSFAPIRGDDGAIVGAAVVARDVTEHKRAEEQVSRSQRTFSELVERAPFGIYIVDSQFFIAHMNAGSQNGAFRNVRPVIGRDFSEAMRILWPEPVAAGIIAVFRHTLETGEPYYSPPFFNPRHDVEAVEGYEWELHRMTLPDGQYGVICYYFDSTKLRQAEQALRESEGRFRAVAENMSEGLMLFDAQGNFTYQNAASLRIHGFGTPEAGHVESENLPAAWKGRDETGRPMSFEEWPISRVLRGERFQDQILRTTRVETGQEFFASYNGCPMVDANGGLIFGFITIREITARKRAEEALRESEQKYRAIGESIDYGVWVCAPDGRNTYASDSFLNLVGMTQEQCSSFGWGDVLHPEDAERTIAAWKECVRAEGHWDIEHRFRGVDGKWHSILARGVPVRDDQGRITCWAGINLDISALKQAEEKLRESEERLRLAQVRGAVGVWDWNRRTGALHFTPELERLYGLEPGAIATYQNWRQLAHPDDIAGVEADRDAAIARHEPFDLEFRILHASGETRWLSAKGGALYDEAGEAIRVLGVNVDITARKQVEGALRRNEAALRESEARFRSVLEGSRDVIYRFNMQTGRFEYISPAAEAVVGFTTEELMALDSESALAMIHTDDRAAMQAALERLRETGSAEPEYRQLTRSGEYRWLSNVMSLTTDSAGQPLYRNGTIRDITDRKQAEERLRASEASLKRSQEIAHLGSWELDLESNRLTWSDEVYRIFGLQPQEFDATYQAFLERVHPDDRTAVDAAYSGSLRDGRESYEIEHRVVRKDTDEIRYVREKCQHVRDAQGRIALSLGMVHDVTARKQVEEALAASENRLRALLESAAQGVVAIDDTGRILLVNARTEELFGYSRDELIGQPLELLVPEGLQSSHPEFQRQFFASPRTRHMGAGLDLRGRRKDGGDISVEISLSFVEEGGKRLALALITDITERKRAEERLRQSQKLESLGLLAGGVAHDFNNLLVGVIGNASLAQEMLPPHHPAAELLSTVLNTGEQAAHLTRQMLAYSGKGKFLVEPLDLSTLIPEMGGLVRPSISKKIALRFDLSHDLPPIEADRGQVQQVFMNLAINAADAIGSHDGLITVKTGVECVDERYLRLHPESSALPPGEYVCLEVRDTGCGMDEATKAKIFDPFFSTKFVGRGLGLAAVSGIVRGHNGAIIVDSAPGQGSCFTVLFPAAAHAVETPAALARAAELQGAGTVLVVDDEQVVREMAKRALERHGYTVLLADSGAAAIDVFRRQPGKIDLVVLDLSMPGMSGEETLPELRKIRQEFKVVVSSGYSESEAMTSFRGQRVSGFVQKPYTSNRIAEKVKAYLG